MAWLPAVMPAHAEAPRFTDVATETGLGFVHWNGMSGELYFPEMTGQGGAFFDYDGDGDLDVYLVQGAPLGEGEPLFPIPGAAPPRDRLFRNDLSPAGPRFVDVTATSGLVATGYGMGVAAGDIDNDGDLDLYVTNFGPNQLWRNRGDGTFEDRTTASGTGDASWSTSAAFVDLDADGWLDLYVVNYVDFPLAENPRCFASSSRRDYCGPQVFPAAADRLLRNRGDGTFEDVTLRWLRGYRPGPGLGVVAADLDGDRRLDLYVANDGAPNQLWLQQADGTFVDDALLAGVAVNRGGSPEASMGLDAGDVDGDGDLDLVLAHLMGETNTLYINEGGGLFSDRSSESGLGAPSFNRTAFGAGFLDVDNDGQLDFLAVNGAVKILEELAAAGDVYPLDQPDQLFLNVGGGRFLEVSEAAGEALTTPGVSRGAAFGDVDDDGDLDVLVTLNNGPVRLLRNETRERPASGWRLVTAGRDALGARIELRRGAAPPRVRRVRTDGSYLSSHDPRVLIGLAGTSGPIEVRVFWPDGGVQIWRDLPLARRSTLYRDGP